MSDLDDLRGLLATVHTGLDDTRAHLTRAGELLGQARQAIIEPQNRADPWLPQQLPWLLDELDTRRARLAGAGDLLRRYEARL